ncbi:MAG TPA: cupin domain-containing protein [Vicinamibacterales bacterium]
MAVVSDPAYFEDVRKIAKRNTWFRHVVYTARHSQLVLMSIPPGDELGDELHDNSDLMYVVVEGEGDAIVAGKARQANKNDVVFVRAGIRHNFRNTTRDDLKLYAVCAGPAFAEGTIHRTREDAIGAMVVHRY